MTTATRIVLRCQHVEGKGMCIHCAPWMFPNPPKPAPPKPDASVSDEEVAFWQNRYGHYPEDAKRIRENIAIGKACGAYDYHGAYQQGRKS